MALHGLALIDLNIQQFIQKSKKLLGAGNQNLVKKRPVFASGTMTPLLFIAPPSPLQKPFSAPIFALQPPRFSPPEIPSAAPERKTLDKYPKICLAIVSNRFIPA